MSETFQSETARYRHLTSKYCYAGGHPTVGVDIGSQGDPVVPWAINFDLPPAEFARYNHNTPPKGPIQVRGFVHKMPFDDNSMGFVYSSHLLEDFRNWDVILNEMVRILRPGGSLIILVPDRDRWELAMKRGQPANSCHKHESFPGELSLYASRLGLLVIQDKLTDLFPDDYTIMFVAQKL